MASLDYQVEELFIRAITESAGLTGYTPALVAKHYAGDDEAATNALYVEAIVGDRQSSGVGPHEVEVKIHLRTLSTVAAAVEDAAWEAVETITGNMGTSTADNPSGFDVVCPTTAAWAATIFEWTRFIYSKSKAARSPGNNMRHRERMIPMEAALQ